MRYRRRRGNPPMAWPRHTSERRPVQSMVELVRAGDRWFLGKVRKPTFRAPTARGKLLLCRRAAVSSGEHVDGFCLSAEIPDHLDTRGTTDESAQRPAQCLVILPKIKDLWMANSKMLMENCNSPCTPFL